MRKRTGELLERITIGRKKPSTYNYGELVNSTCSSSLFLVTTALYYHMLVDVLFFGILTLVTKRVKLPFPLHPTP